MMKTSVETIYSIFVGAKVLFAPNVDITNIIMLVGESPINAKNVVIKLICPHF